MTALVLLGSPITLYSEAGHLDPLVQVLDYNMSIPFPSDPDFPLVLSEPACDAEGFTAVRFCLALEEDFNRVTIQIWDTGNPTPIPIGAQYTFRDESGNILLQENLCRQKNTFVPEGADELLVDLAHPNSYVDETHQYGLCGTAPFDGEVRLRWMHGTPAEPTEPPEETGPCPDCNEACECECDPILGCECDCGDH